jgi:hypothetical protein
MLKWPPSIDEISYDVISNRFIKNLSCVKGNAKSAMSAVITLLCKPLIHPTVQMNLWQSTRLDQINRIISWQLINLSIGVHTIYVNKCDKLWQNSNYHQSRLLEGQFILVLPLAIDSLTTDPTLSFVWCITKLRVWAGLVTERAGPNIPLLVHLLSKFRGERGTNFQEHPVVYVYPWQRFSSGNTLEDYHP